MEKATRNTVLLVVSLCAAFLAACLEVPEDPPVLVQISQDWQQARLTAGHQAHIGQHECSDCHGVQEENLTMPQEGVCRDCHEDQLLHHQATGPTGQCVLCHEFSAPGAGDVFRTPENCMSCHNMAQGTKAAVSLHADEACLSCHRPHEAVGLLPRDCSDCHASIELNHGARSAAQRPTHEQCLDCHKQHDKDQDPSQACASCHASDPGTRRVQDAPQVSRRAIFEGGHTDCATCHQSHDLRASAVASCKGCHEGHQTLAQETVPAHDDCRSCHNPHDVRVSLKNACESCHTSTHSDHPSLDSSLSACVNCHVPHAEGRLHTKTTKDCSSCHQAPVQSGGHGGGGMECASCHQAHSFVQSARDAQLCSECHAAPTAQVKGRSGHQQCTSCHEGLPHHPQTGQTSSCSGCHEEQRHASTKHSECTTCHAPHSGSIKTSCGSCHKEEARTAHAGHQKCQSCHEPHSADPRKPTVSCAGCHKEESSANPHSSLTTGCASCHRPHGPSKISSQGAHAQLGPSTVPACTTCHQVPKLPSLHNVGGHRSCEDCHQPHERGAKKDRASCLGCHQDQKEHQPQAQNCAACHLFNPVSK